MQSSQIRKSQDLPVEIPSGPKGHWFLGNIPDIQRNPLEFMLSSRREYGDLVKFQFGTTSSYLASHPEYVKHILQENNKNYTKQSFDYQLLKWVVGEGLLTSEGDYWLRQRRLIQPAFHRKRIHGFGRLMTETTLEMLDRWDAPKYQQQAFDVSKEMMRLTLAIVGKALFSQDISQEADIVGQSFTTANQRISGYFRQTIPIPLSWPTVSNRKFHAALAEMNRVVTEIIRDRQEALQAGEEVPDDLLTTLLEARTEDTGSAMTEQQLRDEVITLLLAGHETTANALSWTWYLLSKTPAVTKQLNAELEDVLQGRTPTIADLSDLTYTGMVIQEALRLYPPAWIISRKSLEEDVLGNFLLPPGSRVSVSPYVVHRHPLFWENPQGFDPQRFSSERSEGRHSFAYFPFGGGPRLCIGRDFALTEARLVLATVAQRYQLNLEPGYPVQTEPLITLRPKNGIWVRLRPLFSKNGDH